VKGFHLSYSSLLSFRLKGMRNGNWGRLGRLDRALYTCALQLARLRGGIVNPKLLVQLQSIILKLLAAGKKRVLQAGWARAQELLKTYAERGVFDWAPEVKDWLKEMNFIFNLGVATLRTR